MVLYGQDEDEYLPTLIHELAHWTWYSGLTDEEMYNTLDHREALSKKWFSREIVEFDSLGERFAEYVAVECREPDAIPGDLRRDNSAATVSMGDSLCVFSI